MYAGKEGHFTLAYLGGGGTRERTRRPVTSQKTDAESYLLKDDYIGHPKKRGGRKLEPSHQNKEKK